MPYLMAVRSKMTDDIIPRNKKLGGFYNEKHKEGKPFKVSVIAYTNKTLTKDLYTSKKQRDFPRLNVCQK